MSPVTGTSTGSPRSTGSSPSLGGAATGRISTAPQGKAEVGRADVAAVVAAALVQPATIGRFIRFGAGETLIPEAIVADGARSDA